MNRELNDKMEIMKKIERMRNRDSLTKGVDHEVNLAEHIRQMRDNVRATQV